MSQVPISPAALSPAAATPSPSSYTSPIPCPLWSVLFGRPHQTITTPAYKEVASTAMRLLAEASTMLARLKASRRL